jgi:hypothetical protein
MPALVFFAATYGCAHDGSLVMSANQTRQESGPPPEGAYLISNEEIRSTHTMAKLIIISSAWSSCKRKYEERQLLLPSAFIMAGKYHKTQLHQQNLSFQTTQTLIFHKAPNHSQKEQNSVTDLNIAGSIPITDLLGIACHIACESLDFDCKSVGIYLWSPHLAV